MVISRKSAEVVECCKKSVEGAFVRPFIILCDRICINQPSTYFFKIEIMVLVDSTVLADQGAIFIFRIGSCIMT